MSRKSKARIPGKKERGKERIERGSEVRQKKHSPLLCLRTFRPNNADAV